MSSPDEQPRVIGDEPPVGHRADAEADPDQVALDELLRAFAVDAFRVAEEDRNDSEIDRHVDEVLGPATPEGSTLQWPGRSNGASAGGTGDAPIDGGAGESDGGSAGPAADPLAEAVPAPENAIAPPVHVIAIADDEFPPDAVYVEGDLGGPDTSGERPVVFIDDDVVVTETPEDSRRLRRRIEPRLRDRRIAVRRAESRRRLRWVILAVFLLAVAGAGLAVLGSSLFAIEADRVSVEGNVYTDRVRLQAVIDDLVGTPVLAADTRADARARGDPWVEQARGGAPTFRTA